MEEEIDTLGETLTPLPLKNSTYTALWATLALRSEKTTTNRLSW